MESVFWGWNFILNENFIWILIKTVRVKGIIMGNISVGNGGFIWFFFYGYFYVFKNIFLYNFGIVFERFKISIWGLGELLDVLDIFRLFF